MIEFLPHQTLCRSTHRVRRRLYRRRDREPQYLFCRGFELLLRYQSRLLRVLSTYYATSKTVSANKSATTIRSLAVVARASRRPRTHTSSLGVEKRRTAILPLTVGLRREIRYRAHALDLKADCIAVVFFVRVLDRRSRHLLQQQRSGQAAGDLSTGQQDHTLARADFAFCT